MPVYGRALTSELFEAQYDPSGNLTHKKYGEEKRTNTFNSENQISRIDIENLDVNKSLQFNYDFNNRRLLKLLTDNLTGNQIETIYPNEFYEERRDFTSDAKQATLYLKGNGWVIASFTKDIAGTFTGGLPVGTSYFHTNHIGSSTVVTNENGDITSLLTYLPYGDTDNLHSIGEDEITKKFTGQILDAQSGFYYYGSRYYDPEIGRFLSPDAIIPAEHSAQAYIRYSYVFNNPVNYTDPTGNTPECNPTCDETKAEAEDSVGGDSEISLPSERDPDRTNGPFRSNYNKDDLEYTDYEYDLDSNNDLLVFSEGILNNPDDFIIIDPENSSEFDWEGLVLGFIPGYDFIVAINDPDATAGDYIIGAISAVPGAGKTTGLALKYGFTVADNHTYFVGENKVLVHNCKCDIVTKGGPKLLSSPRQHLLDSAADPKLRNRIDKLYRAKAKVGNGSTADAIRHEIKTGELLSPKGHFQKGIEMRNGLLKDIKSGRLNSFDTGIARQLVKDLQNALSGQ